MEQYKVIKDITESWAATATVGDILYVDKFEGYEALFKDGKPVCDIDSECARECCRPLD